jgi:hypothetical protein
MADKAAHRVGATREDATSRSMSTADASLCPLLPPCILRRPYMSSSRLNSRQRLSRADDRAQVKKGRAVQWAAGKQVPAVIARSSDA